MLMGMGIGFLISDTSPGAPNICDRAYLDYEGMVNLEGSPRNRAEQQAKSSTWANRSVCSTRIQAVAICPRLLKHGSSEGQELWINTILEGCTDFSYDLFRYEKVRIFGSTKKDLQQSHACGTMAAANSRFHIFWRFPLAT